MKSLLDRINGPQDIKGLDVPGLKRLAGELRELIVNTVGKTGGHLAPNLGTVELTIALLKTFDPPSDKIVWDVGHQAYAWKILTGRRDQFGTLRQYGGLSGFLRRDESPFDAFGAGHSGTAVSASLGIAAARDRLGGLEHVVAVLGDGAMGCGLSLEALNNVASTTSRLIVVLNDNEMSISANVGSTARYLGKLLANPRYNRWKGKVESAAKRAHLEPLRRIYYRIEESLKNLFLRNVLFEEFGLRYIGPIDGHDLNALLDAFSIARNYDKPIVLHVVTRKGKGYGPAEADPEEWHGTGPFDPATGHPSKLPGNPSYSSVFGSAMCRLAEQDDKVVAITAAMQLGTGLSVFAKGYKERFFDVGICEEHAVVFAAGLATQGFKPVFVVYSTFSQRVVDYIIHDVCLQNLPVVICLDRAGIVGDDGPTHHGVFDIALLKPVPNLVIAQPGDEAEMASLLYSAIKWHRPVVLRYPRGAGPGVTVPREFSEIELGRAAVVKDAGAASVWIWALGDMIPVATKAAELLQQQGIQAGVANARFIKPMDFELLEEHARYASLIATVENGVVTGGFGSGVEETLVESGYRGRFLKFGWPDEFIPQGSPGELMEEFGLTAEAMAGAIASALKPSP